MSRKSIVFFIIIVAIAAVLFISLGSKKNDKNQQPTFSVKRGDLQISVSETGTIKPRSRVVVRNELESSATITFLVDEGAVVKKGDLLVAFDPTELEDELLNQEISLQNAEASFISAEEKLAVAENQAQSDIEDAELRLQFAKMDLEKYIDKEWENQLSEAKQNIDLAIEELARADQRRNSSKELLEEEYISQTEYDADELAWKQKKSRVEVAQNDLELLETYTNVRKTTELKSDVRQAEMALERTKRKARADITQSQADLKAKEAQFKRQKDRYERYKDQLSKTKLYAPENGMVIYETSMDNRRWNDNSQPLEVGQEVRGREEIIYLPTAETTKADIEIHETAMKKVSLGQAAIIKVDAIPDVVFSGQIAKISPLPNRDWLNPDSNKYPCEIFIDENEYDLKNGMNCRCEILIDELKDVVYVPLQAVVQIGKEHFIEVKEGNTFVKRNVEIGLDDNKWIHIVSGLDENDIVSLTPQLSQTEVLPGVNNDIKANGKDSDAKIPGGPERKGQRQGQKQGQGPRQGREQGQMPKPNPQMMQMMQKLTDAEKKKLQNASSPEEGKKIFEELMKKYGVSAQPAAGSQNTNKQEK